MFYTDIPEIWISGSKIISTYLNKSGSLSISISVSSHVCHTEGIYSLLRTSLSSVNILTAINASIGMHALSALSSALCCTDHSTRHILTHRPFKEIII